MLDPRDETHRRNKIELERLTRVLAGRNSNNPTNESGRHLLAKKQRLERQIADYERLLEARQSSEARKALESPAPGPEVAPKKIAKPHLTDRVGKNWADFPRGVAKLFTHSEDYRSVTLCGTTYSLTARQAQMIQILHEAHESGNPEVGNDHILEKLETPNGRWQDTFRGNPEARKALIKSGASKGTLRLNL